MVVLRLNHRTMGTLWGTLILVNGERSPEENKSVDNIAILLDYLAVDAHVRKTQLYIVQCQLHK